MKKTNPNEPKSAKPGSNLLLGIVLNPTIYRHALAADRAFQVDILSVQGKILWCELFEHHARQFVEAQERISKTVLTSPF
jgi:hypothetical protein